VTPFRTLFDAISRNAGFAPEKPALIFGDRTLTYRDLMRRIHAASTGLAKEYAVQKGDRIAHLGYNSADYLVLLFACARLGAILVPLNWRLAPPEQAYIVDHAEPKLLVIESDFADRVPVLTAAHGPMRILGLGAANLDRSFVALITAHEGDSRGGGALTDPLLIVYTSGTTGRPKGAVLTQEAILWNAVNSHHMHGMTAKDHILTVLPMFHVGGLNIQTTPALIAGATVTIHARFDSGATITAIARDKPTLTVLVPATLQALLDHPNFAKTDLSSLRVITTGSTIVPEDIITAYANRGVRVIQVYGSTETGPIVIYERFDQPRTRPGTTGVAGLLNSAWIVDDAGRPLPANTPGEIAVSGPNILSHYWRDEAATREAFAGGRFFTGDIGVLDDAGHFTVRERKKNVIISGGENIYPAEVERVIAAFPGIAECAVIGRPDPKWQEVPIAALVLKPGATFDRAALENHLAENLARFKLPRDILVRDSLPKTALGKVQHFALKAELDGSGPPGLTP
jgi:fatty-acyl-CoA synthase